MKINKVKTHSTRAKSVGLRSFGRTGDRFAEAVSASMDQPTLGAMTESPHGTVHSRRSAVHEGDDGGMALLFLVLGTDASAAETEQAIHCVRSALESGVLTVGIFVERPQKALDNSSPQDRRHSHRTDLLRLLRRLVDARVETTDGCPHDITAVRHFYGTLNFLVEDGIVILEPAWDLHDIAEVLDVPGAVLELVSCEIEVGRTAVEMVAEAILDATTKGIELELASGVLVILWQRPSHRLTVQQVGAVSHLVRSAMGKGGVHLVLTRSATFNAEATKVRAHATLVISQTSARRGRTE